MFKITTLKKLLAVYYLLLSINGLRAQSQNPVWSLPPFYTQETTTGFRTPQLNPMISVTGAVVYGASPPPYYVGGGYNTNYASNVIANAAGQPLVYIVDGNVYDSTGTAISQTGYDSLNMFNWAHYDGYNSGGDSKHHYAATWSVFYNISGYSEACVVPNPQNCQQYYVFTSGALNYPSSDYYNNPSDSIYNIAPNNFLPFYGVIDMSKKNPGGNPGVFKKFAQKQNTSPTRTDSFNVCPIFPILYHGPIQIKAPVCHYGATDVIGTGSSAYNLVFISDGFKCFCLKLTGLTGLGIYPLTKVSVDSSVVGPASNYKFRAELEVVKLSSGNYRVAWPYVKTGGAMYIHMQDYTSAGALVSGTTMDAYFGGTIHGLEFNTHGDTLYVTQDQGGTWPPVGYVPITSPGTIGSTAYVGGSPPGDIALSQIELNYQGTTPYLYFADSVHLVSYNLNTHVWNNSATTFPSPEYQFSNPYFFTGNNTYSTISYLLPDQIDGMKYPGTPGGNGNCCLFYNTYDKTTFRANNAFNGGGTQTWSGTSNPLNNGAGSTVTIGEELRIPAGYVITINNMTLKFSPQARLIIENGSTTQHGGKLILSGCTLTVDNRCITDMWPGVQVWGTPGNTQSANSQGYLIANSSTMIQNAYVGVLAGFDTTWHSTVTPRPTRYQNNPTNVLNSPSTLLSHGSTGKLGGGGIAELNTTTFLNNQIGAEFFDYTLPTVYSTVNTCTLSTNAALLGGATPIHDMGMYNMTGTAIKMYNATFKDTYYNNTLMGLYTYNSNYNLNTSGSPRASFSNFAYGIYSVNPGLGYAATVSVKNTNFNNNYYGAYLGLVNI